MAAGRIVTARDVADSNPDIIIGSWCGKKMDFDWVRNNSEWQTVSAIIHNEIYEIDSSIILQPGPALFLEGLDTVVGTISNYQRKQKSRSNDRL